uniref:Uncharacterized protein n=1 Tax=Plectus sambesii TaxID=2011161 RepID=A0A914V6W5_9BILA
MLEKVKTELELEKVKLIRMTKKLKADLQIVKQDLQMTTETKKTLEQEKMNLNSKTDHLIGNLQ